MDQKSKKDQKKTKGITKPLTFDTGFDYNFSLKTSQCRVLQNQFHHHFMHEFYSGTMRAGCMSSRTSGTEEDQILQEGIDV